MTQPIPKNSRETTKTGYTESTVDLTSRQTLNSKSGSSNPENGEVSNPMMNNGVPTTTKLQITESINESVQPNNIQEGGQSSDHSLLPTSPRRNAPNNIITCCRISWLLIGVAFLGFGFILHLWGVYTPYWRVYELLHDGSGYDLYSYAGLWDWCMEIICEDDDKGNYKSKSNSSPNSTSCEDVVYCLHLRDDGSVVPLNKTIPVFPDHVLDAVRAMQTLGVISGFVAVSVTAGLLLCRVGTGFLELCHVVDLTCGMKNLMKLLHLPRLLAAACCAGYGFSIIGVIIWAAKVSGTFGVSLILILVGEHLVAVGGILLYNAERGWAGCSNRNNRAETPVPGDEETDEEDDDEEEDEEERSINEEPTHDVENGGRQNQPNRKKSKGKTFPCRSLRQKCGINPHCGMWADVEIN